MSLRVIIPRRSANGRPLGAGRYDCRGVSPVIGTILMVAITVVLVSVVWVMANQLLPNFSGSPKVSMKPQAGGLPADQMRVIIENNEKQGVTLDLYSIILLSNDTTRVIDGTLVKNGLVATGSDGSIVYFVDDGDTKMGAGDRFSLSNLRPGTMYQLFLIYGDQPVGAAKWNT